MSKKYYNNKPKVDKHQIFDNFKQKQEREMLLNKGISVPFGKIDISLKELEWEKSDLFEDKVASIFKGFKIAVSVDQLETNLDKIIDTIISLLREDMVELANIATEGFVTMETIKSNKATKNDVMHIVLKAFEVNYRYAKNLIALSGMMK